MALSVDGLNTIDARETTAADARKWVLGPYQTVTISGWQTSQTEARRFEFTTEARSYGQALGKTANLGVISAVFFKERVPTIMSEASNERCSAAGAGTAVVGAGRSRSALPRPRAARRRPTTSTPPPAWADGPATPSHKCGWTSKTLPCKR